jgi:hypothetical protein
MRPPRLVDSLALSLVIGLADLAACSDDGRLLGTDENGGSSAQMSGSGGVGHAGNTASAGNGATAGSADHGGTTSDAAGDGGTTSNAAGDGGTTSNAAGEGGTTSDAAGGQGGSAGQTSTECVGQTCTAGQTCVAYRTVGGAIVAPDTNDECDPGRHLESNTCQPDFGYTCSALTNCSAPAENCHCAAGSKCANTNSCRLPSDAAWLDPSADLICEQQVP